MDTLAQIGSETPSITTPLFDLYFKEHIVEGVAAVNGSRGIFASDLFNVIVDKLVTGIASRIVEIQIKACGEEAVVDGTAPKNPMDLFDGMDLKEEYSKHMSDAQTAYTENLYAELRSYLDTISALVSERKRLLPNARDEVQYAYVGAQAAQQTGFKTGKILKLKDAISFRVASNPSRKAVFSRIEDKRIGRKEVEALAKKDIRKVLEF